MGWFDWFLSKYSRLVGKNLIDVDGLVFRKKSDERRVFCLGHHRYLDLSVSFPALGLGRYDN